jgi:hypothetical protein
VLNQTAKHGLDRALPYLAHALALSALLALPRLTVGSTVNGAGQLFVGALGDAGRFERAVAAILVSRPIELDPAAVGRSVHFFKKQALAHRALVGVRLYVVGKGIDVGFVLPKEGDSSRDVLRFQQGAVGAIGVAGISQ